MLRRLLPLLAGLGLVSLPTALPQAPDAQDEAAKVVEEAERQIRLASERERSLKEYFEICDLDGSGWISYREAAATLGIDRTEFRRYDADVDGGIQPDEFRARGQALLSLLGALPRPRNMDEDERTEPVVDTTTVNVTVQQLLTRFDGNKSKGLDRRELRRLFQEYGLSLSPAVVITQMDPDGSGELGVKELRPLATLVSRTVKESPSPVASIETLSDGPAGQRPLSPLLPQPPPVSVLRNPDGSNLPPRIVGPVTHFQRLDISQDGYIDEADLRRLQAPANVGVRISAILSAMDVDGDLRLSREEFLGSLTKRR